MREIAIVTDQAIFGGGETNLLRLGGALAARHRMTVVAPPGRLLSEAARAGLATVALPRGWSRWIRGVPLHVGGALRALADRFDLVHAYSLHVLPALLGHRALVWTVHGRWEKPWGRRARVIARHARRVIAVSTDVARGCRFPEGRLSVLPLGAVHERDCRTDVAASLSLRDREAVRIGVLGRMQPIKGQDLAIEALARLAAASPERRFELVLAGAADPASATDAAYASRVAAEAARAAAALPNLRVSLPGFVERPQALVDGLDLVLVPSRYESFSMVTVEALARGVPVVVPDCGGPAEIVDASAVGLRFRPGSVDDLALRLRAAVDGHVFEPPRMTARARHFSIERQRDRHLALYDEVLA